MNRAGFIAAIVVRQSFNIAVILNIDHVDGCRENCREENLQLLCPNCHSLTLTFGSLNRGNGRATRYKKRPLSSVVERNLGKIEVPSSILGEGFDGKK